MSLSASSDTYPGRVLREIESVTSGVSESLSWLARGPQAIHPQIGMPEEL